MDVQDRILVHRRKQVLLIGNFPHPCFFLFSFFQLFFFSSLGGETTGKISESTQD